MTEMNTFSDFWQSGPGAVSPWAVRDGYLTYDGAVCVPSTVTGGPKGPGTINAQGLYVQGNPVKSVSASADSYQLLFMDATPDKTITGTPNLVWDPLAGALKTTRAVIDAGSGGAGPAGDLDLHATGSSGVNIRLRGNGSTTPNKFIRAFGGSLQVVNSDYSAVIFDMDDLGNASLATDLLIGGVFYFGGKTAAYPALRRSSTAVEVVLGNQTDFAPFIAATPLAASNDKHVATTEWVISKGYATVSQLGAYLPLAGGTLTGSVYQSAGNYITEGYVSSNGGVYFFGPGDATHPALWNHGGGAMAAKLGDNSDYAPFWARYFNASLGMYYFGSFTAATPALRAAGAVLEAVLGDQSAHANFNAKNLNATDNIAASTGYVMAGGGLFYFGTGDASHAVLRRTGTTIEAMLGDQSALTAMSVATPAAASNDTTVPTTAWVKTAIASGGVSISVGTTPPASPKPNELWWNNDASTGGGQLYVWYVDGTSSQWVPAAASPASSAWAGDIKASASPNGQPGWLKCDGSAVSRTTYAGLFSAIGTLYGVGDGSTTFNIPDYRGRSLFGVDDGAGRLGSGSPGGITGAATLGAVGGAQRQGLAIANLANGTATYQPYGPAFASIPNSGGVYPGYQSDGAQALNITPPAAVVYWYIKT